MNLSSKVLRVLFISHSADLLGAEQSLLTLLKHINREKFEPFVVFPKEGPFIDELKEMEIGFEIIPFLWWIDGMTNKKLFQNFLQEREVAALLGKKIKENEIDVVYTNTIVIAVGALAARRCRVPHVWHIREILRGHPYLRSFLGPTLPFALVPFYSEYTIASSEAVKRSFPRILRNRVVVIYNAFDPHLLGASSDLSIRKELNLSDRAKLIVLVGKIAETKGQIFLLHAFKDIKIRFPEAKLIFVGQEESCYFEKVAQSIKTLTLEQDVFLTGFRRDAFQIMKSADVVVIPSLVEPFGRVALEAMYASRAVVASRTGGLSEIVENGVTGILVEARNTSELVEALSNLLSDRKKAEAMGREGHKRVQQMFPIHAYVSGVEKILERASRVTVTGAKD